MITMYDKKGNKALCDPEQLDILKKAGYTSTPPDPKVKEEVKAEAKVEPPKTGAAK